MKVIDFEKKDKRGFDWLMKEVSKINEKDKIETMICMYAKEDGTVSFGTTEGNNAEMLGIIEMVKALLMEEILDES